MQAANAQAGLCGYAGSLSLVCWLMHKIPKSHGLASLQENMSLVFPTRSYPNQPAGLQRLAGKLEFRLYIASLNMKLSNDQIKLEDLVLAVLKHSPDLLNNVKIGQDQLRLNMKHILFYGGCGNFGQVT